MKRLRLEKVTGVVALSYLVLIPVGGYLAWKRNEKAVADIWSRIDEVEARDAWVRGH